MCAGTGSRGIPSHRTGRDTSHAAKRSPEVVPQNEDCDNQNQFHDHRIPELHRRVDGALELRELLFCDDVPINELCHYRAQPLVHIQFGGNEQRQRHQKAGMHFDVIQERQPDAPPGFSIDQGEEQERQPGEHTDADNPPPQEIESRGGKMGTHQKLEQWPSQNEGEIGLFFGIMDAVHRFLLAREGL